MSCENDKWKELVQQVLVQSGIVAIKSKFGGTEALKQILLNMMAEPIDAGFLFFYPRFCGIRRDADEFSLIFELGETVQ